MENLSVMDLARQFAGKLTASPELAAKTAALKEQLMGQGIPTQIAQAFVASYVVAITEGIAFGMLYVLKNKAEGKAGENEQKMEKAIIKMMQDGDRLVN
jgi:uncharacterized transporter YbjL